MNFKSLNSFSRMNSTGFYFAIGLLILLGSCQDRVEEEKIGILAIGTELFEFVNERPDFWRELIPEIRKLYKGKLTYSENWDKVGRVPFWKELDFIGVNAYFPLNEESSPNLQQLKDGWQLHKSGLADLSKTSGRQVLFTEYGYRNINFAAKTPWDSSREL